jgi:hypothetical protein
LDLGGDEITADSDQLVQRLILTQLQEDVDAVLVLEAMIQFHHIGMMQCLMQFDLIGQSEASAVRFQFLLKHHLGGSFALGLHILSNEAISEPALPQQSALLVLADHLLAVDASHVLADDTGVLCLVLALGGETGVGALVLGETHFLWI